MSEIEQNQQLTKNQIETLKKKINELKKTTDHLQNENLKKFLDEEEKNLNNLYYKDFKERNKEKINEKVICKYCGGSFSYFNKSKHFKTKKCLLSKELKELKERQIQNVPVI
jgi:hypothetical protein